MADNAQAIDMLDELAAQGDEETEQPEGTPEPGEQPEAEPQTPAESEPTAPAEDPETKALQEALAADPELAAKFEYANKLAELGKRDAAQSLYDEINMALGHEPETPPEPKTAEPPPFLRKQAEQAAVDQEIAWQASVARIGDSERAIKAQQEQLVEKFEKNMVALRKLGISEDEAKETEIMRELGAEWKQTQMKLEKLKDDREFVRSINEIVNLDPDLKRHKNDILHLSYHGRFNPYVPKHEQIRQLKQAGVWRDVAKAPAIKISPKGVAAMRAKNAPKITSGKAPSTGSAPSRAANSTERTPAELRRLQMYAANGMKHLGV